MLTLDITSSLLTSKPILSLSLSLPPLYFTNNPKHMHTSRTLEEVETCSFEFEAYILIHQSSRTNIQTETATCDLTTDLFIG
jgi:hypothetical protein